MVTGRSFGSLRSLSSRDRRAAEKSPSPPGAVHMRTFKRACSDCQENRKIKDTNVIGQLQPFGGRLPQQFGEADSTPVRQGDESAVARVRENVSARLPRRNNAEAGVKQSKFARAGRLPQSSYPQTFLGRRCFRSPCPRRAEGHGGQAGRPRGRSWSCLEDKLGAGVRPASRICGVRTARAAEFEVERRDETALIGKNADYCLEVPPENSRFDADCCRDRRRALIRRRRATISTLAARCGSTIRQAF